MPDNEQTSEPAAENQLRLDHFLKRNFLSATGGHAKLMIQNGEVLVNGKMETRRRRKLVVGDVVQIGEDQFLVDDSSL